MATQREILKRIKSVSSTRKITKTMEMVATSKMKKMQKRLQMSEPYFLKVNEIIDNIRTNASRDITIPLFQKKAEPKRALIILVTGNRGLCGGFNSNMINGALAHKEKLLSEGREDVGIYVFGKKGVNTLKFLGEEPYKIGINHEDKLSFEDAASVGNELIDLFITDTVDEVYISYTKVLSSSSQKPVVAQFLPVVPDETTESTASSASPVDYIFDPTPEEVFGSLLPLYVKVKLYTFFLETGFAEMAARRIAMKNANDAANEMVRELTIRYNRARQAKITNEIAEIVGGAAALE